MKTRIISVANHKGGVGKTTTVLSLSGILASKGYRVLVIDLDGQANLTDSLISIADDQKTVFDAMTGAIKDLPVVQVKENLFLVPGDECLSALDIAIANALYRESILSRLIKRLPDKYDFIFLDCPPAIDIKTLNAFVASTDVIIPITAEFYSVKGVRLIGGVINNIKENDPGKELNLLGLVINRWEDTKLANKVRNSLCAEDSPLPVFKTVIRKNVRISEASGETKNIVEHDPNSNGALDFLALTEELLTRL